MKKKIKRDGSIKDLVLRYIEMCPDASATTIAKACNCGPSYVYNLRAKQLKMREATGVIIEEMSRAVDGDVNEVLVTIQQVLHLRSLSAELKLKTIKNLI